MRHYVIYDTKTGHIVQTHFEVDASGRPKHLDQDEVLAMLRPDVSRKAVGVAVLEKKPQPGTHAHVDVKTGNVVVSAAPAAKP